MHTSTYDYPKPTNQQLELMVRMREAAKVYGEALDALLPDGLDKPLIMRAHRLNATWANAAITRLPDETPRADKGGGWPGLSPAREADFPAKPDESKFIDVLFDGPPGPMAGRFVEIEGVTGKSVGYTNWIKRKDGYWALRIPLSAA